jgi:hypothetical protein
VDAQSHWQHAVLAHCCSVADGGCGDVGWNVHHRVDRRAWKSLVRDIGASKQEATSSLSSTRSKILAATEAKSVRIFGWYHVQVGSYLSVDAP